MSLEREDEARSGFEVEHSFPGRVDLLLSGERGSRLALRNKQRDLAHGTRIDLSFANRPSPICLRTLLKRSTSAGMAGVPCTTLMFAVAQEKAGDV